MTTRKTPCPSCPYRLDTPSGVWDAVEYEKLPLYDLPTAAQPMGLFLCHDADRETVVCRGWFEVHGQQDHARDLLAVRVALARGTITAEDLAELAKPCGVALYASGAEACAAGMAEIENPSPQAVAMTEKIRKRHGL